MIYRQPVSSVLLRKWSHRFYATSIGSSTSTESYKALSTSYLTALQTNLPNLEMNTNIYDRERHGKGESYHPTHPPSAILYPQSTMDVTKILPLCKEYNVPVIPFGAGSSVEGHVCAIDSSRPSISLDMTRMNDIESFPCSNGPMNSGDFYVTVGAGVTRLKLNESLRYMQTKIRVL